MIRGRHLAESTLVIDRVRGGVSPSLASKTKDVDMSTSNRIRLFVALGSFLIGVSFVCAGIFSLFVSGAAATEEVLVDGVLHVRNGETPRDGITTVQLQEVWRVGGEDDEHIFGVISDVLVDDAGNLYLLDMRR
jgi:hypothetical protein